MNGTYKRFLDPLYGRTVLSDFEYEIALSPEVQRLRYIRMCNINSLLVVGAADIRRYEHSLGVLRLANEWIRYHPNMVTSLDADCIRAAALLHDLQTGPFGHSLQYVLEDNDVEGSFSHDDLSVGARRIYFQDLDANASFAGRPFTITQRLGERWERVAEMIRGEGRFGPLIAGVMDLDNIDNVVRLAYHSGLTEGGDLSIPLQLARGIEPYKGGISASAELVPSIEQWQKIRKKLYEFLLHDWADFSAKAMLTSAMEIAIEAQLIGSDSWVFTDEGLFDYLEHEGRGEAQEISELIRRVRVGDLYHPILLAETNSMGCYATVSVVDEKKRIESNLASIVKREGGPPIKLIFHPILDKGKTERGVPLHIGATEKLSTVGRDSKRVLVGVFASRHVQISPSIKQALVLFLEACGISNLRELPDPFFSNEIDQQAPSTCSQLPLF